MTSRIATSIIILILACAITVAGKGNNTLRQYHDSYLGSKLCDTIVTLCPPTKYAISKAIEVRASSAIKNKADASTSYGVAWGINCDGSMYQAILNSSHHSEYDDIAYNPSITLTLKRIDTDGHSHIIMTKSLTKRVDIEQCHNTLSVEINCQTGDVDILAGNKMPQIVAEQTISPAEAQLGLGIVAISRPDFDVIVSEQVSDKSTNLQTSWTTNTIDSYLSELPEDDTIEGYWQYLDRNNDSQYCRLGGKYRVAIIANSLGGYDIIYVSGADVSASEWKPGMLKGRLEPTKFKNHYNLIWIDSMLNHQSDECSATLEQGSILRFDFPLLNSSMRFYKE